MLSLLVSFLIFALVVCVIAWIVDWILSNIPGFPPISHRLVWAVAGIVILIWLLGHLQPLGVRF